MAYNLPSQPERFGDIALALGVSLPRLIQESQGLLKTDRLDPFTQLANKLDFTYLRDALRGLSSRVRGTAADWIGGLSFIDHWLREQAARAGIERIRTLNRQLAFLTKMPLDLAAAGVTDELSKRDQVVATALEDGSMLYNPVEPTREAVEAILKKILHSSDGPLAVTEEDLHPLAGKIGSREMTHVFRDADSLYDILLGFFETLREDPEIGPALAETGLCIQFVFRRPEAVITVDARQDPMVFHRGDFSGTPEVTMTMDADFAHKFWHGKANLVTALTTRQVTARGNVPRTIKLLPILKPAYAKYPVYLQERGLAHLILS
jgi:hypothetical protein